MRLNTFWPVHGRRYNKFINHSLSVTPSWRCFSEDSVWMEEQDSQRSPGSGPADLRRDLWKTICSSSNRLAPRHIIFPHYFSMLPLQRGRKGVRDSAEGSGVRRRRVKMQVRLAPQLCPGRIHSHGAIWPASPSAVCQALDPQRRLKTGSTMWISFSIQL